MKGSIIYHVDVNSAFLSWHACHLLDSGNTQNDLRDIPSIIGGSEKDRHGVVLAKSTWAKSYGIVTGEPIASARKKCPNLTVISPCFDIYVKYSKAFIDILKSHSHIIEQYSIDEAFCDMSGMEILHGDCVTFAHKLKDEIYHKLGFTVNIGISSNKVLAKMASDFEKPDKVHTLFPNEIQDKLWPLPIEDLFFIGKASSKKLRSLGIKTIGELANSDLSIIKSHLKKHGELIWNYANGIDTNILNPIKSPNKSYGNSITTSKDVTDYETGHKILLSLCETVGARLRDDKTYIRVVSVSYVDYEFHSASKQITLDSTTNVTEEIFFQAKKLFDSFWDGTPLRQLGVSTGKATDEKYEQLNLFDYRDNEKLSKLDTAIDAIRGKFGDDAIKRASSINSSISHTSGSLQKAKNKRS